MCAKWIILDWLLCCPIRVHCIVEPIVPTVLSLIMTTIDPVITISRFVICSKLSIKYSGRSWSILWTGMDNLHYSTISSWKSNVRRAAIESWPSRIQTMTLVNEPSKLFGEFSRFSNDLGTSAVADQKCPWRYLRRRDTFINRNLLFVPQSQLIHTFQTRIL